MRGGSHGDWNRFLCSQILGAERDTMLLTSRQPSVSSSNPTKTTPGEVLPGGVAVAVAASPGTCGGGSPGCARRAGARGPLPKGNYWRQSPGGRRRSRSLEGGFPRVPTGEAGPEAVDAFGTLGGARCGTRYARVRRQGWGHGRFHPSQPRTGIVTFRGTATEGQRSLSRPATTGTGRPRGAGCTVEAGWDGLLLARRARRPHDAFEALGNASAGFRRSSGRRVHPSPQADGFNGHNVVVELGPVGAGRLAVACTSVCKLSLFNGFGADAGGRFLGLDPRCRPPSICISG